MNEEEARQRAVWDEAMGVVAPAGLVLPDVVVQALTVPPGWSLVLRLSPTADYDAILAEGFSEIAAQINGDVIVVGGDTVADIDRSPLSLDALAVVVNDAVMMDPEAAREVAEAVMVYLAGRGGLG